MVAVLMRVSSPSPFEYRNEAIQLNAQADTRFQPLLSCRPIPKLLKVDNLEKKLLYTFLLSIDILTQIDFPGRLAQRLSLALGNCWWPYSNLSNPTSDHEPMRVWSGTQSKQIFWLLLAQIPVSNQLSSSLVI